MPSHTQYNVPVKFTEKQQFLELALTSCLRCKSLVSTFWAPTAEYGGGSSDGVIMAGWDAGGCAGCGAGMVDRDGGGAFTHTRKEKKKKKAKLLYCQISQSIRNKRKTLRLLKSSGSDSKN